MKALSVLVLAQAQAPAVGAGRLVGGWEYIGAAYALSALGLVLYGLSLWVRLRKQEP